VTVLFVYGTFTDNILTLLTVSHQSHAVQFAAREHAKHAGNQLDIIHKEIS